MAETVSVAEPCDPPAPGNRAGPVHAARGSAHSPRRIAGWVGIAAVVAAAGVGIPMALRTPGPLHSAPTSLQHITVAPARIPLPDSELAALLDRPAQLGMLADGRRRAACLAALGYPGGTAVLGATEARVSGRPAIVLVLADDGPDSYLAIAVAPTCNAADTGRLASTTFTHRR